MSENEIPFQLVQALVDSFRERFDDMGYIDLDSPSDAVMDGRVDLLAVARDLLAEGWRPPARVITDTTALSKLPDKTAIHDSDGDLFERRNGQWCNPTMGPFGDTAMANYLPITVLWMLEETDHV